MKKYFLILVIFQLLISSCVSKNSILNEKLPATIIYKQRENCKYYCDYVLFRIENNQDKAVYFPLSDDVYTIYANGKDISSIYIVDQGYFETWVYPLIISSKNGVVHLKEFSDIGGEGASNELMFDKNSFDVIEREKEYIKKIDLFLNDKYEKILSLLPKEDRKEFVIKNKELLRDNMYDVTLVFIEAHSYVNFRIELNTLFENKEYNEISIVCDYNVKMPTKEDEYYTFYSDDFNGFFNDKIKLREYYPKKLFNKYHLIKSFKAKDTLKIDIK